MSQEIPFDFRADNKDFWKLEIHNLVLTVLTLGIYGAWAAVKRRKYLAEHTYLDGANFEYTADPKVILRSRIAMAGVYVLASVSSFILPLVGTMVQGLFFLALPWAVASTIAFQAKNTTYRGARFSFRPDLKEVYIWYFKMCALYFCTLGLAMPIVARMSVKFITDHMRLGGKAFSFEGDAKPFMKITMSYVVKGGACILAGAVLAGLSGWTRSSGDPSLVLGILFGIGFFAVIMAGLWVLFSTGAEVMNLIFERITFGEHRLQSNQDGMSLFQLFLTNQLLVIFTLGLGAPIAVLRMRRYRYDHLKVLANGPLLEGVSLDPVGGSRGGSDAVGLAMLDIDGGFDFGL